MASKLEFERKFLLLKKPVLKADSIERIEQHYFGDDRIRRKSIEGEEDTFYHTIKKNLKPGVNSEDERKITRDEYYELLERSKYFVLKNRHYYYIGSFCWEIDVFQNANLVIAEIECPSEEELNNIKIPKFLDKLILKEITSIKEFSSKNIAKKLNQNGD